jgi:hypothetical protein
MTSTPDSVVFNAAPSLASSNAKHTLEMGRAYSDEITSRTASSKYAGMCSKVSGEHEAIPMIPSGNAEGLKSDKGRRDSGGGCDGKLR